MNQVHIEKKQQGLSLLFYTRSPSSTKYTEQVRKVTHDVIIRHRWIGRWRNVRNFKIMYMRLTGHRQHFAGLAKVVKL